MSGRNRKCDVFISYEETTGLDIAEHLRKALKRQDISAFVARQDIQEGNFKDVIQEAVGTCDMFIVILTANVSASRYVKEEIDQALQRAEKGDLKILPCRHEELTDEDIPTKIKDLHMTVFNTQQDLARKILQRIESFRPSETTHKNEADAEKAGIKHIFTNRRFDSEFEVEIRRQLIGSKKVLMMSNSLRDFFGDNKEAKYNDIIMKGIEKGTEFRLLLLNPLSEAAKDRSIIENGIMAKDDKVYVRLPLFKDIERVANWLHDHRTEIKGKIETRFSSLTPTVHMIKTDEYTFIEPYHVGSLQDAEIGITEEDEDALCLGGYVPVSMVFNSYPLAKLTKSHFGNVWDKAEKFDTVFNEIEEFVKPENQKNYRRGQFIDFILKNASNLQ